MGKLIVNSFLTMDGVMQAPGGEFEDPEGGFKDGGWQLPFFEDVDEEMAESFFKAGSLLLGRKTYDIFAGYWPGADKNDRFTSYMNDTKKYVVSHKKLDLKWKNSRQVEGNLAAEIQKLKKQEDRDILVFGSGDLCQALMRESLVDEFTLTIHPLVLGHGKRLFRENSPKLQLKLVKSKVTKLGVFAATYQVKPRS